MCFKVAYIGSIGEGVERLVQESEQLVVEKLEVGQEKLEVGQVKEKNGNEEEMEKRVDVEDEIMPAQSRGQSQGLGGDRKVVGTQETKKENEFNETMAKGYDDASEGDQNVGARNTGREASVEGGMRSKEQLSSSDKEQQEICRNEFSGGEESIKHAKTKGNKGEKEESCEETLGDPCQPDQPVWELKQADEEDEDIMREIEEHLKDISLSRM